ncbi:ankyrin repeat-containing protein [Stylonychia lemnae]|uniref:Ankyrin repeat-containing protein n=1 Tax=Stylonychia lemnae TaxID=5949 RepID=A0A078A8K6_STYLE|nr:ankyrin repeat-containing protein [Stylonychia lemnae]|eukprot:CDW78211.1 ankyrin repeat-containing protein [Stylonychia lemnae]
MKKSHSQQSIYKNFRPANSPGNRNPAPIPSTQSNPSLTQTIQYQPTFQSSSNTNPSTGGGGGTTVYQSSGVPMHGELRKKQREQNFLQMQEQYRLRKKQEEEEAQKAKKAKLAKQKNQQQLMLMGRKNLKINQEQYFPDLGPNNFLYIPDRQISSANSLIPSNGSRIRTFTQNNNFVQNVIIQQEDVPLPKADSRQEEQLKLVIQKVETLISQNQGNPLLTFQILDIIEKNMSKLQTPKNGHQTPSSSGRSKRSNHKVEHYQSALTERVDKLTKQIVITPQHSEKVINQQQNSVQQNNNIDNQHRQSLVNFKSQSSLLQSDQSLQQQEFEQSSSRSSSLADVNDIQQELLRAQSSYQDLLIGNNVNNVSSQVINQRMSSTSQVNLQNQEILIQKLETLKIDKQENDKETSPTKFKQNSNLNLETLPFITVSLEQQDQFRPYLGKNYRISTFQEFSIETQMLEALKYKSKKLQYAMPRTLEFKRRKQVMRSKTLKFTDLIVKSPMRKKTERLLHQGSSELSISRIRTLQRDPSNSELYLTLKMRYLTTYGVGLSDEIIDKIYDTIKILYNSKMITPIILDRNDFTIQYKEKIFQKFQLIQKQSSPIQKKVTLKQLKNTFKYSQTDFQTQSIFTMSPVRKLNKFQMIDDFVFDQQNNMQTSEDKQDVKLRKQETVEGRQTLQNYVQKQSTIRGTKNDSPTRSELAVLSINRSQKQRPSFKFNQTSDNLQKIMFPTKIIKIKEIKVMQIITQKELQVLEQLFIQQNSRQKEVKKSLLRSLTTQVQNSSQNTQKYGSFIKEAQVADSIMHYILKKQLNKIQYLFSKPELVEKNDIHFEEERLEDQIAQHRFDLKLVIKEEDTPDKKQQDFYLNEILNQLDMATFQPERFPSGIYVNNHGQINVRNSTLTGVGRIFNLNQQVINIYFKDTLMYFYAQKNLIELDNQICHIRRGNSWKIMDLCNKDIFNSRFQQLTKNTKRTTRYQENERNEKRKLKMQQRIGLFKNESLELYSLIKDFIFRRNKIPASEIVKILFQQSPIGIFHKLFDPDEDYELSLTLDHIIALAEWQQSKKLQKKVLLDQEQLRKIQKTGFKIQNKLQSIVIDKQHLRVRKPSSGDRDTQTLLVDDSRRSIMSEIQESPKIIEPQRLRRSIINHAHLEMGNSQADTDFLPIQRKNAIRRNMEIRKTKYIFSQNTLNEDNYVLQTKMFKRHESTVHNNMNGNYNNNPDSQARDRTNNQFYYEDSQSAENSDNSSLTEESEDYKSNIHGSSIDYLSIKRASHAKQGQSRDRINRKFSIKIGRIDTYVHESKFSVGSNNEFEIHYQKPKLITKFGYECVVQINDTKQFMFEVFMPVELKSQQDREQEIENDAGNILSDSFETNGSLKNFKDDKFADYDVNIQRQNLKKFFQQQKIKKNQYNSHSNLLNVKGLKLERSLSQTSSILRLQSKKRTQSLVHNFQSIGTYYKNLAKRKREEKKQKAGEDGIEIQIDYDDENCAAEIISVEDLEENDQDNFYLQMQNNLHIMELLKEVGISEKKRNVNPLKDGKYNSMNTDTIQEKKPLLISGHKKPSEMESLFNNSQYWDDATSLDLLSQNSERSEINQRDSDIFNENYQVMIIEKKKQRILKMQEKKQKKKDDDDALKLNQKGSKYYQNSDFLKRNLYMKDQGKIEKYIINAVVNQKYNQLKEFLPKYELSLDSFQDSNGNTLLSAATQVGGYEIVKLLLNYGSDANIPNNEGNTALHYAIKYGFPNIADLLISFGANESIANKNGKTPWEDSI